MVLASVTTFVLNPLLFPETLSPSMPTSENEISFRFFVSVFFTFDLGARPTSENEISFRFLCPFFFRPPRTRAGADLYGNLVLYAIFVL